MPKHCTVSGIPVELSLQLVLDGLGLPGHGGESWSLWGSQGECQQTPVYHCQQNAMSLALYNFFQMLSLLLLFLSNAVSLLFLWCWPTLLNGHCLWLKQPDTFLSWPEHFSAKPLNGAQQRGQNRDSTCKHYVIMVYLKHQPQNSAEELSLSVLSSSLISLGFGSGSNIAPLA